MRIDLIKCMVEILERHQQVALPGLGRLFMSRNNAIIQGDKIHPPFHEIRFDDKIENVSTFIDYISETYKLSSENAEKVLKKFSQRLINRLVNYNEVLLPQIGVLKNGGSSPIQLIEDPDGINFHKNYLPILDLKKVSTLSISPESSEVAKELIVEEPLATFSESVSNAGTVVASFSDEKVTPTLASSETQEGGSWWMNWWPLLGLLLLVGALMLFTKMCKSDNNNPIVSDNITEDNTMSSDTISEDEVVYNPNRMYEEHELDQIPQDELESGCVIIVGSFEKAKNAVNMVSLIESRGYNSFTSVNDDGLTRTGILFNCLDQDLVDFLQSIRTELAPKAWYLQPRLHIEYQ